MKKENYFSENLKQLAESFSQRKIAEKTNVSPASVNNYIKGTSEPSIFFLMQLKKAFGISIDEFLFNKMEPTKEAETELSTEFEKQRFAGHYIVYYYDSRAYKGMVSNYAKNTLSYGVISVVGGGKNGKLKMKGLFAISRKEAEICHQELCALAGNAEIEKYYASKQLVYDGTLEDSKNQIFIHASSKSTEDQILIILNNPPSTKTYVGGLGTVNSVSRGREHMPCVQFVFLSRNVLSVSDGELYNMLTLDVANVNMHLEIEQLITLFKNVYVHDSEFTAKLSDYQKQKIIEDSVSNMLSELIEANLFRFAKISNMEDDNYFRVIMEEKNEV